MKKSNKRSFLMLIDISFIFIIFSIFSQINCTVAYYGNGNCLDYHGITKVRVPYDPDASIVLDGVPNEPFWTDPANQAGRIGIPMASKNTTLGPPDTFVYMNATFIITDNYLLILCEWNDSTTAVYGDEYTYDGLYMCWNIDCPNFSANFFNNMRTEGLGGGYVDSWKWFYSDGTPPTATEINGTIAKNNYDWYFGETGWECDGSEIQNDFTLAWSHVQNEKYIVEIKRKLDTGDQYDVQITEEKLYLFNVGVVDHASEEDHAISWTHALDLTSEEETNEEIPPRIPGFLLLSFVIITISSVTIIIVNQLKRNKVIFQKK